MDRVVSWLVLWVLVWPVGFAGGTAGQSRVGFGRDLLEVDPVPGRLEIAGRVGEVWRFDAEGLPPTDRVAVSGDVRLRVGMSSFTASRATVWMQRIEEPGQVQVFVYAEGVDTPTGGVRSSLTADELTVAARIVLEEPPVLAVDSLDRSIGDSTFVLRSEAAFDRTLGRREPPPPLRFGAPLNAESESETQAPVQQTVFRADGRFALGGFDRLSYVGGGDGSSPAVVLHATDTRAVAIEYRGAVGGRSLTLSAKRAVVLLKDGADAASAGGGSVDAGEVDGVYLEGGVIASDDQMTLRAERVYYSVKADRALILDAVMDQYNTELQTPLYIRAKAIRQESPVLFSAKGARVSNTGFARPHLSLGASRVTIRPKNRESWDGSLFADARNITLRPAGVPVFWLPRYRGDPSQFPLRQIAVGVNNRNGVQVGTRWDLLALLGVGDKYNADVELGIIPADLRGTGLEVDAIWSSAKGRGSLFAAARLDDQPEEVITAGGLQDPLTTGDRGLVLFDYRADLTNRWSIFVEVAETTDPTFVDEFYRDFAANRREFRTGAALIRRDGNTQNSLELSGSLDPYPVNYFLITGDGFQTQRLPEGRYSRFADDVFPILPGSVTSTTEASLGLLQFSLTDRTPGELGIRGRRARDIFGVGQNEGILSAQQATGLRDNEVVRFDVREEVSVSLDAGPVELTPFFVGRATAYDSRFSGFSPEETERARLWGSAGLTASTEVSRVYEGVRSNTFNLHRLRHVVSPTATVWHSETSIDDGDLPVYDDAVESIADGSAYRLGISQRFQTQRGGPGRWESVDVLTINAEYVDASQQPDRESAAGRWYDARPESSVLHEHGEIEATWHATESLAVVAGMNYDFELDQPGTSHAGARVAHSDISTTQVSLRSYTETDNLLLIGRNTLELSEKYSALVAASYDSRQGTLQNAQVGVFRRFQAGEFGITFNIDEIRDETSFGFFVRPLGLGQGGGVGGLGAQEGARGQTAFGRQ